MKSNLLTFIEACCLQISVSRHRSCLYWNQFAYVSFVLPWKKLGTGLSVSYDTGDFSVDVLGF